MPCIGTCVLTAVHPDVAPTGATIVLEGNFGGAVTVNFPGGASVAATVLGSGRAVATVPAGATGGTLSVTTGGSTVGPVYFRRTSFTPKMGVFSPHSTQDAYAHAMPKLVEKRAVPACTVARGSLHVFGGYNGSVAIASAERMRVLGHDVRARGTVAIFGWTGKRPCRRRRIALEGEHSVDGVLETRARAGEAAVLRDVADEQQRNALLLRHPAQFAHGDGDRHHRASLERFASRRRHGHNRLNRVDDGNVGVHVVDRVENLVEVGLALDLKARVELAEPLRAARDGLHALLSDEVQRALLHRDPLKDLERERRLPDARRADEQRHAAGHNAAAKHAIDGRH